MILDLKKYTLSNHVKKVDLTKKEFILIRLLADNNVHYTKDICRTCKFKSAQACRTTICRLRKKIKLDFQTVLGVGYRLDTIIQIQA